MFGTLSGASGRRPAGAGYHSDRKTCGSSSSYSGENVKKLQRDEQYRRLGGLAKTAGALSPPWRAGDRVPWLHARGRVGHHALTPAAARGRVRWLAAGMRVHVAVASGPFPLAFVEIH